MQDTDSIRSFESDSDDEKLSITRAKTRAKGTVHSRMKRKPQKDLKVTHVNAATTVALIHTPQDPPTLTKLDKKKPTTRSNINNSKLSERKNKKVPQMRDGMELLSSRKMEILRSKNKTDRRKESLILSRRRSTSESSFNIISSSDSDELPDRRMETNLQTHAKGTVHSRMKRKPQNDLKLTHVNAATTVALIHTPQDPPTLTKLDKKKPTTRSNTNNSKLSERKNKQVSQMRGGMEMLSSRKMEIQRSENKTDRRKESLILSRRRSTSESSITIISSSDSDEHSDRRMETNLQEKRDIHLKMAEGKENEMFTSTPLPGKSGMKIKNWPSPIAVLHSRFKIVKKRNVSSRKFKLQKYDLIYNTSPHDQNKRSSTESQNGNLDSDSDKNAYPPSLRSQENFNSECIELLQSESELRLLTKRSSRIFKKSDENSQAKSVIKKSVHIEDAGDMKRLKQNTPKKINRNIEKIRDEFTAEPSTTAHNAIKVTETAGPPVNIRRSSPRKVQFSVNCSHSNSDADDEGEVITRAHIKQVNSRKVIKNVNDSPEKVERNSHKEESHTMIIRGKRSKAASDYNDKTNNDNTEKKNNNKRRKATDHTTLSNYETNRKKDVAVPGNDEGLRRSKRTRVRPVAYWTGERVNYKMGSDRCPQVIGLNPGNSLVDSDFVPKKKKSAFKFTHLLTDGNNPEKNLVPVPFMGNERKLECFSTLRFDGNLTDGSEQKVSVYTGLEIPKIEAGYISIAPSSYMRDTAHDNMFVFFIITGTVFVTIHRTKNKLRNGEFFCVPEGVSYKIKNVAESEAVLSFTKCGS